MSDAWGAVIAAAVSGVLAIVGGVLGYRSGRRQVADQAVVEHEQWLRGQRQEAYLGFLRSLDRLLLEAEGQCEGIEETLQDVELSQEPIERRRGITGAEMEETNPLGWFGMELYEELDGLALLGPEAVVQAGRAAVDALVELGGAIRGGIAVTEGRLAACEWGGHMRATSAAGEARGAFVSAVRRQIQSPAQPVRRRWWWLGR